MTTYIEILGNKYQVETKDNKTLIDGKSIDEFLDSLDTEEILHLSSLGFDILRLTPDKFKDLYNSKLGNETKS